MNHKKKRRMKVWVGTFGYKVLFIDGIATVYETREAGENHGWLNPIPCTLEWKE